MNDFVSAIDAGYALMSIEFTIYGFTLSFWKIMIWSIVATIVIYLIVRFLHND